nr:integrase, catalytic region, zinc finger, CCHC-type, peptidase aspartic, catalytic [Tanacetum cinerariifolium]
MLSSTGVNLSTSASGSQPSGNTKKDKIQQTPSSFKKNKIEAHPRNVRCSLSNKNCVVKTKNTASVQNSMWNVNSDLQCVTLGNAFPLTRITTTAKVPLRKSITHKSNLPKPVVTLVYSQKPKESRNNVPVSKSKINKSVSANKKEPNKSWISIVSNVLSSSIDECRLASLMKHLLLALLSKTMSLKDAKAVATTCFTQNRSIIRLHHDKTSYELLHDKLPDLSYFYVFGALCYPTNDSENLKKLQLKADIAMAFEQSSSGPALHEMTPATISSGLVPKPTSSTPFIPPLRND